MKTNVNVLFQGSDQEATLLQVTYSHISSSPDPSLIIAHHKKPVDRRFWWCSDLEDHIVSIGSSHWLRHKSVPMPSEPLGASEFNQWLHSQFDV